MRLYYRSIISINDNKFVCTDQDTLYLLIWFCSWVFDHFFFGQKECRVRLTLYAVVI